MQPAYTFTREDRSRGGTNASLARREQTTETGRRVTALRTLADAAMQIDMPEALIGVSMAMLEHAFAGELPPIKTPLDQLRAMQTVDMAVKLARLLRGESTSNTATLNVDMAQLRERFEALETESQPA